MISLTERQQTILQSAVDAHIECAQPVGSKLLLDHYGLTYSSATIRHEMGELEGLGYLEQPHVSAGRVPTDAGYRFYVDHAEVHKAVPEVTGRILARYSGLVDDSQAESFAESAAGFLASLLRETGVIVLTEHAPSSKRFLKQSVFIQGTSHILEKPEFQDLAKVRKLLKVLEAKQCLLEAIDTEEPDATSEVRIGHENSSESLYGCSVVRSSYVSGAVYSGTIAVIGPRRMRYERIVPLVEKMTQVLKQVLHEREGEMQ